MRQKWYVNVLIVLVTSATLLFVWFKGVDYAYAKVLQIGANICLAFSPDTSIGLKLTNDNPTFVVKTVIEGKKGVFPQKANLILLPFIMILTWQILLFFNVERKKALRSTAENLIAFYIVQVIYLLLLTGYYKSGTAKFLYDLLLDSFYIIILFLIVKDTFKFGLIHLARKEGEK
jgi:small-conductance mechanosensitive channel